MMMMMLMMMMMVVVETDDTINDRQMMSHHDEESFVEREEANDDDDDDSETDSSHSQESSAAEEDEELEENDDDEDDGEEEEDDDEDDDDAGSDNYGDDQDEYFEANDETLRLPYLTDREENILPALVDDPFFDEARPNNIPLWGEIGGGEAGAGSDALTAGAGSTTVAPSHPLLMGRSDQTHGANSARAQARSLTRQRGFRYIQLNPRTGSSHGSSQILQQLLGTSGSRDLLGQFTESTRLLVMDSGFAILDSGRSNNSRTHLHTVDRDLDQAFNNLLADELNGFETMNSSSSALNNVPNALVRWTEESRVIDGDSLHDCVTVCKPEILDEVEKHREEELSERREKRRKVQEEEELVRKFDEEERKKKEPEMATTPAPEAAGHSTGSADEMDVVVSENAAVSAAVSISGSAQRFAEDLMSSIPGLATSTAVTSTSSSDQQQQLQQYAGQLVSSLQELLPRPDIPPTSLSSVLQSISQLPAQDSTTSTIPELVNNPSITTSSSSESMVSPSVPPTFQFTTPAPLFPTLPIPEPAPAVVTGQSESMSVDAPASALPDAIGPLSPSPDQSEQTQETGGDVTMTSDQDEPAAASEAAPAATEQAATEAPPTPPAAGSSGTSREPDYSAILGDIEIPEGVDPSFLAALPEDMRQEVIEEQRRLVRARQQPPGAAAAVTAPGSSTAAAGVQEVNPEFLAALPPNIQEEVLAQQRLEQARQRQATSDPTEAVNAGEFFQTLPPSLRQSLLAEMEESQISALPADMAAEAQNLRQERDMRSRQIMHDRYLEIIL